LSSHSQLLDAIRAALETSPLGASASRLITGNHQAHRVLEQSIANWKRAPAALLFNSGYHANVGTISALASTEDAIYSDALNHASIIDGCRLSGATIRVYPHADPCCLRDLLADDDGRFRRRLIVTDSIFSMDGDSAPLPELASLAKQHGAMLMVDEAHAAGVVGPAGRGLAAAQGVDVDISVGTLGKAFGTFGAYVVGSHTVVEYLINRARSFIFTTALPPPLCAASTAAIELAAGHEGDLLRDRLRANAARFASGMTQLGLPAPAVPGHIVRLVLGAPERTMRLSEALLERGIFAQGIRPPTVPAGTARLRFALSALHTADDIDRTLAALGELWGMR
jgi:8-amino-7-oxononanoate synthase